MESSHFYLFFKEKLYILSVTVIFEYNFILYVHDIHP